MEQIECPYCLHEFENYTDPFDQEEEKEMQCPRCQEYFMVICEYSAYYKSRKIEESEMEE